MARRTGSRRGRRGTHKKSQYHVLKLRYLKSKPGSDYTAKKIAYHRKRLEQARSSGR